MYITQEADYAVRIVYCLAKCACRKDARSISEEVCVTLRFSLKILGKLSAAGIVNSFKGNKGGYELARPAAEITLKDVLSAVEGPYVLSRCISDCNCSRGAHDSCTFQRAFSRISDSINQQLGDVSFAGLLEDEGVAPTAEEAQHACGCAM
ncbi:Rrf2 family transcriptional regulator [Ruminococcaceae bacterium OttesenSCG-928-O06]|nr:Rrf2 family transcriptional regulator [Ruminococcaceae bacterium OttesenSCG-928-O06]